MPQLPVSILIPAYNCAGALSEHVSQIAGLIRECGETIFIASISPDGTHDLASQLARTYSARFVCTPRGLFASWNIGVQMTTSRYCYFSTVGDQITLEGLRHLVDVAESTQADLVITPPILIDGNRHEIADWPIFKYRAALQKYEKRLIPSHILISHVFRLGASCLIGSSASAIYKSSFLKARPFPTTFHNYGDSAWMYKVCSTVRLAYSGKAVATFVAHHSERAYAERSDRMRLRSLYLFAQRPWIGELVARDRWVRWKHLIHAEKHVRVQLRTTISLLNSRRGRHPASFWWLQPRLWKLRFQRDYWFAATRIVARLQLVIMQRLNSGRRGA